MLSVFKLPILWQGHILATEWLYSFHYVIPAGIIYFTAAAVAVHPYHCVVTMIVERSLDKFTQICW